MRFAITSQNFRTITGHAGKARRFIIFEGDDVLSVAEKGCLDLPLEMSMHAHDERFPHPLDGCDVLITAGSGDGFVMRMARRGTRVVATAETVPLTAVRGFLAGTLKPPQPHDHAKETETCGCGH